MNLLSINKKIKGSNFKGKAANFSLPALETCPNAGACARGCYAMQGAYRWSNVYAKHKANYNASLTNEFIGAMTLEVRMKRLNVVRIHDAGDFYNYAYAMKWVAIAEACPDVTFYAYTKMVNMFDHTIDLPDNFIVIYSMGGKQDQSIDVNIDRHSQVFANEKDLEAAGYVNASKDDALAIGINPKIGLVYHGAKSKQWGK